MDRLQPNQQLNADEELVSNNGWFRLRMFADGSLVIYRTQGRLTITVLTRGPPGGFAVMIADGNFACIASNGVPYWDTRTAGYPGATVVMQDDGNLVVYDVTNHARWASNTVQDLLSPTIRYSAPGGYMCNETSESWKDMCRAFPCFRALQWPGYATEVIDATIGGQAVVIQLWKGWCPKFLGLPQFPGGIGAEVGVYRRIPGKARAITIPAFLPDLAARILNALGTLADNELWWPFPELGAEIDFVLTNPVTGQPFLSTVPQKGYWVTKWMDDGSYHQYQQAQQTPGNSTDYILDYKINGQSRRWGPPVVIPRGPTWSQLPGLGKDISVGPDGSAWLIGTNPVGVAADFGVLKWNGTKWIGLAGVGGVRVAAGPGGTAWLLNSVGQIYRYQGGTWSQLPGLGRDISVGPDGSAWLIGTNPVGVAADFGVLKWNGTKWIGLAGVGGVRVAAGPGGTVWLLNSVGQIYRYQGGTWSGALPGLGKRIALGADGSVWLIGTNPVSFPSIFPDFGVFKWNGTGWDGKDGGGIRIAVGPGGEPWLVNSAGQIFRGS